MISLVYVFWMYVILFAIIGWLRGWAKELLVAFSVVLALMVIHVLFRYVDAVRSLAGSGSQLFWFKTLILIVLVFFGYQTVISVPRLASKALRERFQDSLFGIVLGAINGYLIAGSVLFFLNETHYPFPSVIIPPQSGTPLAETLAGMMKYMPPAIFGEPGIYFAVALAFIFVLVVYI